MHMSVTKSCVVEYGICGLWDLCVWSIDRTPSPWTHVRPHADRLLCFLFHLYILVWLQTPHSHKRILKILGCHAYAFSLCGKREVLLGMVTSSWFLMIKSQSSDNCTILHMVRRSCCPHTFTSLQPVQHTSSSASFDYQRNIICDIWPWTNAKSTATEYFSCERYDSRQTIGNKIISISLISTVLSIYIRVFHK